MTTAINWEVAEAQADELRRLESSTEAHPYSRFVYLVFGPNRRHRK